MNAYYHDSDIQKTNLEDKATSAVCSFISLLTNKTFVTVAKLIIIALALVGFVATLGKINDGTIGFFMGVVVCAICAVLDITAIGSMIDQKK